MTERETGQTKSRQIGEVYSSLKKETIVEEFLSSAARYPELPAVEDERGAFSYAQLDELSNLVADVLMHSMPESAPALPLASCKDCRGVAVILSRKKEVLAAILGVLRSGNCYVFSAPDAPADRAAYILDDAEIACVITEKSAPPVPGGRIMIYMEDILERFRRGERPFVSRHVLRKREDPAFITYTSGSTGAPKGVLDTYAYIDSHNRARHLFYTPAPGECIGSIVSFSYAASTYDLFSGLTVGCNLYIFSDEELLNQNVTVSRVLSHNITSMFMIPSMIPIVFAPGARLPIRLVLTAGEKARKLPEITAVIAEIYGSSEAAAVTGRVAAQEDSWDLLGRPLPGTELYLLDERGNRITEPGQMGELAIVNDALALGYLNHPEETEKKFRPCPFHPGQRMYVSGDLMRFDEDGNYYYCGRRDNMIKINGQRVEMGEIEAAIVRHPAIEDAVCGVVTRNHASMPVCWYLLKENCNEPEPKELEAFTLSLLPRYMVPVCWERMKAFPRNVNGKVDRHRLPEPDFERYSRLEPPKDYSEEKLLEAARRMLPDILFGVTDDMLRLGMNSVKAVQFVTEAEKIDPRITVSSVMRLKNIRDILGAPKKAAWFSREYDDKKPVVVLLHGIVPVSGYASLCALWSSWFNVFEIEPFPDHMEQVKETAGRWDYDTLTAFYMELLEEELPKGARLWGFAGYSFGGQLAVSLAEEWRKRTGEKKTVLMGDTLMHLVHPGKRFPVLTEDDPYIRMVSERSRAYGDSAVNEPMEMILKKQNAVIDLLNTVQRNTRYEGPIVYLDAKLDWNETMELLKLSVVKALYPSLRIFSFPGLFHNDLYLLNDEMLRFYRKLFQEETQDGLT